MAVIYKALDTRLNRYVAIKVLKDEFAADPALYADFTSESQAVAMLSHPNIVAVYDVSSSNDANYIVMELIEGITLIFSLIVLVAVVLTILIPVINAKRQKTQA
jgi:serine/threonine-protein kinase